MQKKSIICPHALSKSTRNVMVFFLYMVYGFHASLTQRALVRILIRESSRAKVFAAQWGFTRFDCTCVTRIFFSWSMFALSLKNDNVPCCDVYPRNSIKVIAQSMKVHCATSQTYVRTNSGRCIFKHKNVTHLEHLQAF